MPLLQSPQGNIVSVSDDEVNHAIGSGYKPVSTGEAADTLTAPEKSGGGIGGAVTAGLTSLASGATLGASDILLSKLLNKGQTQDIAEAREAHPIVSGIGQVGGALATGGEGLLSKTPQGVLSKLVGEGVEAGKEIGGLRGLVTSIGATGIEGAAQNAGMYLSDVALGDRDLSAEGLGGALGTGFAFGSAGGGAVLGIEKGTMAARRMFARLALGGEDAATEAEQTFMRKSQETLDAHEDAANIARKRLDEIRQLKAEAQETRLRANDEIARAKLDEANGLGPQPKKQVFDLPTQEPAAPTFDEGMAELGKFKRPEPLPETAGPASETRIGAAGAAPAAPKPTSLEEQLAATKSKLDSGESLQEIQGTTQRGVARGAAEHPLGPAVAEEEQKLESALADYDARRSKINEWIEKYKNPRKVQDMEAPGLVRGRRYESLPGDVFVEQSGGQLRTIGEKESTLQDLTPNSRILARSNGADYWKGTELDEAYQDAVERAASVKSPADAHAALQDATAAEQKIHDYVRSHKQENAAVIDRIEQLRRDTGRTGYDSALKRAENLKATGPRNVVEQVHEATQMLGDYEKSAANLVDAIGDAAPPVAKDATQAYRAAEDTAERKFTDRMTRAIDDHANEVGSGKGLEQPQGPVYESPATRIENAQKAKLEANAKLSRLKIEENDVRANMPKDKPKLKKEVESAAAAKPGKFQRVLGAIDKAGQGLEIASMAGIPGVPAPHDLPVIGPMLGMFLKFRALSSKLLGRVPANADARAAALAARTQEKLARAVDRSLGIVERAAPRARSAAVATTVVAGDLLKQRLFDDGYPDAPKNAGASELIAVRARELAAAISNPQAVIAQVRKQLAGVTDPDLIAAAEQHQLAKIGYLADKAPKEPPPSPLVTTPWRPNGVETMEFARRLAVANDPAVAFEQMEQQCLTPEAAETLRAVYPKLFAQTQQRLISQAPNAANISFQQRQRMSLLFDVSLDPLSEPDTVGLLQTVHAPSATKSPAAPPANAPPTPSIAGPVDLSKLYAPQFSRVARS